jgi:hypothetical protein
VQLTDGCGGITRGDHIKRCGNGVLVNIGRNNAHWWLDFGRALHKIPGKLTKSKEKRFLSATIF